MPDDARGVEADHPRAGSADESGLARGRNSRRTTRHTELGKDVREMRPDGGLAQMQQSSGSGKSSLLAVASTLISPDSGTLRIRDVDATALSLTARAQLRRESIGIIFQRSNLIPSLTAEFDTATILVAHDQRLLPLMSSVHSMVDGALTTR